MNLLNIFGTVIGPVSDFFKKKQERKLVKETAKAKLDLVKANGAQQLELSDAEWESIAQSKQDTTWKDEYITVIITMWIPLMIIGGIYAAFSEDQRFLEGVQTSLSLIKDLGIDMELLTNAVVFAGLGLKLWRK